MDFKNTEIDLTFITLDKVINTAGKNDKVNLLSSLVNNRFAEWYLNKAYNPFITFGIVPNEKSMPININNTPYLETDWNYLEKILIGLEKREITGNNAQNILKDFFYNSCRKEHYYWIMRMIQKDLKMGAEIKSINKAWKQELIPVFEVQLCNKYQEIKKPNFPYYISPKLDGHRCIIIHRPNIETCAFTRQGKPIYNINHILNEIKNNINEELVLDGELMGKDWNETSSISRTIDSRIDSTNLKYNIFDILSILEWNNRIGITSLDSRIKLLNNLKVEKYLNIVEHRLVNSEKDIEDYFARYIDLGYEGAVIKETYSYYEFSRSNIWLKIKKFKEKDLEIVGYFEGKGEIEGMLGGFIVDNNGIEVKVGSGFSQAERINFWNKKEELIGTTVEIKYFTETKDGSLQFPVFLRLRPDKD